MRSAPAAWLHDTTVRDPVLAPVLAQLERLAANDDPVLLVGEVGTGRGLAARALHNLSGRAGAPFVTLGCEGASELLLEAELLGVEQPGGAGKLGAFEQAGAGSVLLAEVGALPAHLQQVVFDVLDRRAIVRLHSDTPVPLRARCLATTSVELDPLVEAGLFHAGLHARLAGHVLALPPLRARAEDIPALAQHFLDRACHPQGRRGFAPEVASRLRRHSWPGNLRELQRVVGQAAVAAPNRSLGPGDFQLPTEAETVGPATSLREAERQHVLLVLERAQGHQRQAARILGISRWSLARRLRKYAGKRPSA